MHGVVVDPGHDVRPAKPLRVLERRVRDLLTGFEIDQPDDDGCRAEIDREAVNRTGGAGNFFAGRRLNDAVAGKTRTEVGQSGAEVHPAFLPLARTGALFFHCSVEPDTVERKPFRRKKVFG